jgi:hypothetical protein
MSRGGRSSGKLSVWRSSVRCPLLLSYLTLQRLLQLDPLARSSACRASSQPVVELCNPHEFEPPASEGRNARRGGFCAVAASMLMSFPRTRSLRARFPPV